MLLIISTRYSIDPATSGSDVSYDHLVMIILNQAQEECRLRCKCIREKLSRP